MKIIKTEHRTNLNEETLNDLVEIFVGGPPLSLYSADCAVELWWSDRNTTRQVNQTLPRKEYRSRASSSSTSQEKTAEDQCHTTLEDWDEWFSETSGDNVITID